MVQLPQEYVHKSKHCAKLHCRGTIFFRRGSAHMLISLLVSGGQLGIVAYV